MKLLKKLFNWLCVERIYKYGIYRETQQSILLNFIGQNMYSTINYANDAWFFLLLGLHGAQYFTCSSLFSIFLVL